MTPRVTARVAEFCRRYGLIQPGERVVVGVSGGPDSLCLLHLLLDLQAELELNLTIAHLNHQLRGPAAEADAAYVQNIAARWQTPLRVETSEVATLARQRRQSIEETARQVRYAFLGRVAAEVGATKIAVGHNADDQVETILMHLLRGSGLAGLRGMLPKVDLASLRLDPADLPPHPGIPSPQLIRPLLEIWRSEIEAYCCEHQLAPRQDDTNQDITFFRNRLRHELIPYLETYNPNLRQVLLNTARVITAEAEILSQQLAQNWSAVVKNEGTTEIEFDLEKWLALPLALKRSTLRRAVQQLRRNLRDLNFEHIEQAIAIIESGVTGSQATLPQGLKLTLSYRTFTIAPEHVQPDLSRFDFPCLLTGQPLPLNLPGVTLLPHTDWQLRATLLARQEVTPLQLRQVGRWEAYLDADVIGHRASLRPRQPGDIFCPLGLAGRRQKVADFMINEKIPATQRDLIPLLVANEQVLWLCGYRADERARIRPDTRQIIHLKFEPR